MPARTLKFATDFFALQIIGRWPVMAERSAMTESITLAFSLASPAPTLTTIFSSFGICITLLYENFFIRAGAASF